MQRPTCSLLSIAPYRFVPPVSGGQLAVCYLHHYLGMLCRDIIVSTTNNEKVHQFSFDLQPVFPVASRRYAPFYLYSRIADTARAYDATHIICEHPYMALTAMLLSKKLKLPWYMRSHNIESERFRALGKPWWRILRYYERFAMSSANGVFFITAEDAAWAMEKFRLKADRCHVIPYGTGLQVPPAVPHDAKQKMAEAWNIDAGKPWLYFLGALDYAPNAQAVSYIADKIIPLLSSKGLPYEVLIGGKGLSTALQHKVKETPHMHYMGFVPDLDKFINACDVMLNPVLLGGGVKTKAIEALAYNKTVVSVHSGAAGIDPAVCGDKLFITPDNDWNAFADAVIAAAAAKTDIPPSFYKVYYWGNIAQKALSIISNSPVRSS